MVRPVSRGVIGVERAGQSRLRPMSAEEVAGHAYATIVFSPDTYQLKDRRDIFRRLARGDSDIHGRRLFTEAARMDARYIIKIINARLRGKTLMIRQCAMLRNSLLRVYQALQAGNI